MHKPARHRGVILPLVALLMVVIFGFVAFAVDIGYIKLARTQLQAAADAGARAGVLALGDGPSEAKLLAQNAAQNNVASGSPVQVFPQEDIQLGNWDTVTRVFTPLAGAAESDANSVRITCRCVASRGTEVPTFVARVFGTESVDVVASAIARNGPICGVLVGIDSAELNGNPSSTDSYDATLGPYSSQIPGDEGHICSNGPIDVQNGTVNGNALPGEGYSVTMNKGSVTGSITPRTTPLSIPPVDFGDVATNNDNANLPVPPYVPAETAFRHNNGNDIVLPPGTYYFTDFSVTDGPIRTVGPVTIYVRGDFIVSASAIINETGIPANLRIFVEGNNVKIGGSADFYGIIYAPSADIQLKGSSAFYGAALGRTLKFNNTGGVHADVSLSLLEEIPSHPILVQ